MGSLIHEGFLSMKKDMVKDYIQKELELGANPMKLLQECQEAMEEVGKKFEAGDFFISELIYSAEVFKAVSPILEEKLASISKPEDSLGPIIFGTPQGDIHDLGKNLVITFMRANGFEIIDLGVDVPSQHFIDKLKETNAPILAMSALITPGLLSMRNVIGLIKEHGLRDKTFVLIGGGVTTELVAREVGADSRGLDPVSATKICKEYLKK